MIRFRSDHEGELDTAVREARQAVEKGEANVRWMGEHYQVGLFRLLVCVDGFKSRVTTFHINCWDANVLFRVCIS